MSKERSVAPDEVDFDIFMGFIQCYDPTYSLPPVPPLPTTPQDIEQQRPRILRIKNYHVRSILMAFLENPSLPFSDEQVLLLCNFLKEQRHRDCQHYECVLWGLERASLTTKQQYALLNTLTQTLSFPAFQDRMRHVLLCIAGSVLFILIAVIVFMALGLDSFAGGSFMSPIFFVILSSHYLDYNLNKLRARAVETLGVLASPAAFLPLTVILHEVYLHKAVRYDFKVRPALRRTAPAVLKTLTPNIAHCCFPESVLVLCSLLSKVDQETCITLLHALGNIGNRHIVQWVERMAQPRNAPAIQDAAKQILPTLYQR
jgi:hypothetical protein